MDAGNPQGAWDFARRKAEIAEQLAIGLSRWHQHQDRLTVKPPAATTLENVSLGLDVPRETVLSVSVGLQTESPNPRSTKWKR